MSRLPRWATLSLAAFILVAAGIWYASSLLGAESYRTDLVAAIDAWTGGATSISGFRLRLFPSAGFTIDHLVVNDGPDERAGARLVVRTVRGRLALRPLLRGDFQVTAIEFSGVTLEWPGLVPLDIAIDHVTIGGTSASAHLSATLGAAAAVSGTVTVADLDKPLAQFDLTMPVLDLRQLSSLQSARPNRSGVASESSSTPALMAQGRIRADRVRFAPLEGTQAEAAVQLFTGHIEIAPITMQFYEGTLDMTGHIERRVTPAEFSVSFSARQANVVRVLDAFDSPSQVTGTVALDLRLTGAFGAIDESLTGQGTLEVRDGTLPGFRSNGMMGTVARLQDAVTFGAGTDQYADTIPYSSFTGDVSIEPGRIRSQRLRLDSAVGTVNLRGYLGFDERLSYEGLAALVRGRRPTEGEFLPTLRDQFGAAINAAVGRTRIPFSVRGTVRNPKVGPGVPGR
jgi:uncharacterized protein involved in outer membrane biogenesis